MSFRPPARLLLVSALVMTPSWNGQVRAADAPAPETETVVVEGSALPPDTGARDTSAFATIIPREQFAGTGTDLGELLERTVGVRVKSFGGIGDLSTISIRGSTAEQVEIFLDGIPLNRALGGGVDLSTLPLGNLERIEVYRGTAPAGLAVSNLGGAVELTSSPAYGEDETSVSLGGGSFSTLETQGSFRRGIGPVHLFAGGGYARSEGDFEFLDDHGTPKNTTDDEHVSRRNNDFQSVSFLGKSDVDLPADLSAALVDDFFWKDEGVPGIGSNQSNSARLETLRNLTHAQLRAHDRLDGLLDLEQRFELGLEREQFRDLDGEIGIGAQDAHNRTLSYASVSQLVLRPDPALTFTTLADLRREEFRPEDDLLEPSTGPTSERSALRAVLEAETRLFDERLVLDPALRFAYVEDDRQPFGPFASGRPPLSIDRRVTWKVGARGFVTEWLEARANASTAFRAPSFTELFGDRGSVVGNPDLEPERGTNWDVGLAFTPADLELVRSVRLEAIYFDTDTTDRILFIQNSQRTAVAQNIARSRNRGVELTAVAAFPVGFRATANATFQRTEDLSAAPSRHGNDLPGQPRSDVVGRLEWREAPVTLFGEIEYLGDNFLDPANLDEVGERFLVASGFKVNATRDITFTFEGRNLADDRIADVQGYPLPGRSFFGSVEWRYATADSEPPE